MSESETASDAAAFLERARRDTVELLEALDLLCTASLGDDRSDPDSQDEALVRLLRERQLVDPDVWRTVAHAIGIRQRNGRCWCSSSRRDTWRWISCRSC